MKTRMTTVTMETLMATRQESVNPSSYPDEVFELFSIPAYDAAKPDIVMGREIGSSKKVVKPGDVLLSRIVPHIRRAWVVPKSNGKRQIGSGEWIVFRGKQFDSNYLRHLLMSDIFHVQFMNTVAGVGGSLLRARPAFVAKIEFPLPPLSEQKRIAAILDKADSIRRKRQETVECQRMLLRSAFLDICGHPQKNPKNWPTSGLADITLINRGKFTPRPRNDPRYYGGIYPFIQTGELTGCDGVLHTWKQTLNEEGIRVSRSFPPGTVCIAIVGATIGETAILGFESYCPDSVIGIQPIHGKSESEYIEYLLRFYKQPFRDAAPETARANINLQTLTALNVPVPPLDLQHRFSEIYRQLYRSATTAEKHSDELSDLFNSLVQRAFQGEL